MPDITQDFPIGATPARVFETISTAAGLDQVEDAILLQRLGIRGVGRNALLLVCLRHHAPPAPCRARAGHFDGVAA